MIFPTEPAARRAKCLGEERFQTASFSSIFQSKDEHEIGAVLPAGK